MVEDVSHGVMAFLIVTTLVFAVGMGVPAVVIGFRYNDVSQQTCGFSSLPPLWIWVQVYGITALCFGAVLVVAILAINSAKRLFVACSLLFGCFNVAWNIVGAVALFRDGMDCQTLAYPLWAMTLACLIVTWANMFLSCFVGVKIKN
jgi:hypothetical protein